MDSQDIIFFNILQWSYKMLSIADKGGEGLLNSWQSLTKGGRAPLILNNIMAQKKIYKQGYREKRIFVFSAV